METHYNMLRKYGVTSPPPHQIIRCMVVFTFDQNLNNIKEGIRNTSKMPDKLYIILKSKISHK